MAITYPLDLRTLYDAGIRFYRPTFGLEPRIATVPLPNLLQTMETASAVWKASWRTVPLGVIDAGKVEGFLDALGGARRFLAYDVMRPWPIRNPAGVGLAAETFTVSTLTATRITLSGATGLKISAGDRVGLEQSGKKALFRVLETVDAVSGAIGFDVAPAVPSGFTTSAICRVRRPVVEMILDPGNRPSMSDLTSRVEWSFAGVQAAT